MLDSSGYELAIIIFTSVIHERRKFPRRGGQRYRGKLILSHWAREYRGKRDARIADSIQARRCTLRKGQGNDPVQFSQGVGSVCAIHAGARYPTMWNVLRKPKRVARIRSATAINRTRVKSWGDIDWGNLEDYLLDKAQTSKKRLTVFYRKMI